MCKKNKNDIGLKTAGSEDAANIAGVEKECLNVAWSENQIRESLASGNYRFFIALDNDIAVGSGGIRFIPPEAEITNIAEKASLQKY